MKTVLVCALFGALFVAGQACYDQYEYKCVKDHYAKRCKAIKVCEGGHKEKCGDSYCEYPYKCAYKGHNECKDYYSLKAKCEHKKVCKEVKTPCGAGYCSGKQDCVKEQYCEVKYGGYGRRLMGDDSIAIAVADANAYGDNAVAIASANAYSVDNGRYGKPYYPSCSYCQKKEKLECWDDYKCVDKEDDCKDVIVKKCVKDYLRPGIDVCHGGYSFYWYGGYENEQCGDEYCGYGEKCAEVVFQKCKKECGDHECGYGYECGYEGDCDHYAYLDTICKDYYEPTCVALDYYAALFYKPSCKYVYKCDDEYDTVCGYSYCGYGYKCVVEKKDCYGHYYNDDSYYHGDDYHYGRYGYGDKYEDKYNDRYDDRYNDKYDDHYGYGYGYEPKGKKDKKSTASASSTSTATKYGTSTETDANATGNGEAEANGYASGRKGEGNSYSAAGDDSAYVDTYASGEYVQSDANAHYSD